MASFKELFKNITGIREVLTPLPKKPPVSEKPVVPTKPKTEQSLPPIQMVKTSVGNEDSEKKEDKDKKSPFRAILDELARQVEGISYKELPVEKRLAILEEGAKDLGEDSVTREAIQNVRAIISEKPTPDHMNRLVEEFAKLPETDDFYGLEADIQRTLREDAVRYVADQQVGLGIGKEKVNEFALLHAKDRGVGGMQIPDRFAMYDNGSPPTNNELKNYLNDLQEKIDVYGFTQESEVSIDQEAKLLGEIQTELVNRASGKDQVFKNEAQQAAKRIRNRINGLVREKMLRKAGAEIENRSFSTAEELMDTMEDQSSLRYIKPKDVKRAFEKISTQEEKDEFILLIQRQIRDKLAILEESSEPWELRMSLDPTIQELSQWLLMIREVDPHAYHKIHTEAEARQWLHNLYRTMMKGASPTETKELLGRMQDYDAMELYDALSKTPGVAEAFRLWEAKAEDLIAAETDPLRRESIIQKIKDQLKADKKWDPEKTGISVDTAVVLAERHYKESGRDAMKYRQFIRKNKLIQIRNENGVFKYYVDPHAPLLWDPYRLLYCPEAMWGFFQFGSDMEGASRKVTLNGRVYNEMILGQGVGADVLKSLLDNKFDLRLTDFYSRRKDYITSAWIDKKLEQPEGASSEDSDIWFNKLSRGNSNEIELNKVLRECIELKYRAEFAQNNGLPIWGGGDAGKMKESVEKMKAQFPGRSALLDRAYSDYTNVLSKKGEQNMDGDFFLDISHLQLENIDWNRMRRLHEVVRGNFRDHFAGLEVFSQIGKFIGNPSFDNLSKLDPDAMKAYTSPFDAQMHFMIPAYLAFCDVQRGKGLLGGEVIGLIDTWKSKYSKVYDTKSMTDLDLYKIGRQLVTQGKMTRDALYKVRGEFPGYLRDKLLENADPLSLMVLFMALAKDAAEKTAKDLEK